MKNIGTKAYGIIGVQVKNYANVISASKIEGLLLDALASTRAISDRSDQRYTIEPEYVVAMVFCTGMASESTDRTNIVQMMEYPRRSNRRGRSSVGASNLVMSLDWNDFSSANMKMGVQSTDRDTNRSRQHAKFGGLAYFLSEKFQRRHESDADVDIDADVDADANNLSATTNVNCEEYGLEIDSMEIGVQQQAGGDATNAINSSKRKHGDAFNEDDG
jgi:hypothetical protein